MTATFEPRSASSSSRSRMKFMPSSSSSSMEPICCRSGVSTAPPSAPRLPSASSPCPAGLRRGHPRYRAVSSLKADIPFGGGSSVLLVGTYERGGGGATVYLHTHAFSGARAEAQWSVHARAGKSACEKGTGHMDGARECGRTGLTEDQGPRRQRLPPTSTGSRCLLLEGAIERVALHCFGCRLRLWAE